MFLVALLAIFVSCSFAEEGDIDNVVWTEVAESELLTEDEHKVAFRDVVLEGVIRRVFHVLKESSKLGYGRTRFPPNLIVRDPLPLTQDISFKKTEAGLVDIDFKAWGLSIMGLHNVMIKNIHVLRHIGLKDIRVVLQLVTDITLAGNYSLQGTGLSLLPVTGITLFSSSYFVYGSILSENLGYGDLKVKVSDLMLTGETFLIVRENEETKETSLHVKEMDLKMTNQDLDVKLEKLMGGGLAGSVANDVLRLVGDELLYSNKDLLADEVKAFFRKEVSKFLSVEEIPLFEYGQ